MADNESGQIGYRARLQARKAAASTAGQVEVLQLPQTELQLVDTVVTEDALPPELPPEPVPLQEMRTPAEIRTVAEKVVAELLPLSDAQYTERMTELSTTDPMLYAAVSDMIANAAAVQAATADGATEIA
jgi:hypothetical protein